MYVIVFDVHTHDTIHDSTAMIQYSMHNDACRQRKCEKICYNVCRWQVKRGIFVIRCDVERMLFSSHDTRDVVGMSCVIIRVVGGHGQMRQVPNLAGCQTLIPEIGYEIGRQTLL